MTPLSARHCTPSVTKLGPADAAKLAGQVVGWRIEADTLVKVFSFKDYYETMAFVNMAAWIAHREDHHPDMTLGYNQCRMAFSTHSVGGLSENDFICAARIESALTA